MLALQHLALDAEITTAITVFTGTFIGTGLGIGRLVDMNSIDPPHWYWTLEGRLRLAYVDFLYDWTFLGSST